MNALQCVHLGPLLRSESGRNVRQCERFGECTLDIPLHGRRTCQGCEGYKPSSANALFQFVRPVRNMVGFNFHRSGWPVAMHALGQYDDDESPLLLEDFVEQNFCYRNQPRVYGRPWVGIFHHPCGLPSFANRNHDPQHYFARPAFQKSVPHLRLAIALSEHLASFLRRRLACPVVTFKHPTAQPELSWSVEHFRSHPKPRLAQIGWYLRNTRAIYQVRTPEFQKVRLWRARWNWYDQRVRRHWSRQNTRSETAQQVDQWQYVDNARYDRLLSSSVVINEFFAASANNVIVECIARGTPIITNRHPAICEYLGQGYPLYFEHPEEVTGLATLERVLAAHEYLKALDTPWLSPERFAADVVTFIRSLAEEPFKYAVVCAPRTGSSWFCELIASTQRAGRPFEWWNEDRYPWVPLGELIQQQQLHGVFGVKAVGDTRCFRTIYELDPEKIVWLRRRDQVEQAVSLYLATRTGRWDSRSKSGKAIPPFDESAIGACLREVQRLDEFHARFCRGRDTLTVWYEDVLADPKAEVRRVLRFLGRSDEGINPQATLKIQRDHVNADYCRRFRGSQKPGELLSDSVT